MARNQMTNGLAESYTLYEAGLPDREGLLKAWYERWSLYRHWT